VAAALARISASDGGIAHPATRSAHASHVRAIPGLIFDPLLSA